MHAECIVKPKKNLAGSLPRAREPACAPSTAFIRATEPEVPALKAAALAGERLDAAGLGRLGDRAVVAELKCSLGDRDTKRFHFVPHGVGRQCLAAYGAWAPQALLPGLGCGGMPRACFCAGTVAGVAPGSQPRAKFLILSTCHGLVGSAVWQHRVLHPGKPPLMLRNASRGPLLAIATGGALQLDFGQIWADLGLPATRENLLLC